MNNNCRANCWRLCKTVDVNTRRQLFVYAFKQGSSSMAFVELYSGFQRQFRVNNLAPSTSYVFRLAAVNPYGKRYRFGFIILLKCSLLRSYTNASCDVDVSWTFNVSSAGFVSIYLDHPYDRTILRLEYCCHPQVMWGVLRYWFPRQQIVCTRRRMTCGCHVQLTSLS
jgi:hypothetical protein